MKFKITMTAGLFALLQGCMTSHVDWIEKGMEKDVASGGVYAVSGSFTTIQSDGTVRTGIADKQEIPANGSPLPVRVDIKSSSVRDTTGGLATFNNIFSVFTLGIWPYVSSSEITHTITVIPPSGDPATSEVVAGRRCWSSFILPIGALPCPGWGNARGFTFGNDPAGDDPIGLIQCKKEAKAILSDKYYETEMGKYIAAKKELREKRLEAERNLRERTAIAVKGIQAVLSEQNKKNAGSEDRRSVVLLDMKDIQDRTTSSPSQSKNQSVESAGDIKAVMDELETTLSGLGFRVVTKNSIGRSAEERVLYDAMDNKSVGGLPADVSAYRVEVSVFQYGVERREKKDDAVVNGRITVTRINRIVGRVDISLKFINIATGETEYSIQHINKEESDERCRKVIAQDGNQIDNGGDSKPMVPERILAKALKNAFETAAKGIVVTMKPFRVIECDDNGELILDATELVVKNGDKLRVYARGKGKSKTGRQETPIAIVRVTEARADSCTAVFEQIDKTDCGWNLRVKPMSE